MQWLFAYSVAEVLRGRLRERLNPSRLPRMPTFATRQAAGRCHPRLRRRPPLRAHREHSCELRGPLPRHGGRVQRWGAPKALNPDDTLSFVRAFMLFSMLANLAEDRQGGLNESGGDAVAAVDQLNSKALPLTMSLRCQTTPSSFPYSQRIRQKPRARAHRSSKTVSPSSCANGTPAVRKR